MNHDYWLNKWQAGDINFHRSEASFDFIDFGLKAVQDLPRPSRLFFPLCGKSKDMAYALTMGHYIIGAELSQKAVEAFFAENSLAISATEQNGLVTIFHGDRIEIHCGDIFDSPLLNDSIDFVFDSRALVALPEELRKKYTAMILQKLKRRSQMVLVSLSYDEKVMAGPPFSVSDEEVMDLYGKACLIERLYSEESIDREQNLRKKGLTSLITSVFNIIKA